MQGKLFIAKRKFNNKRKTGKETITRPERNSNINDDNDSIAETGIRIDYTCYLLLFKLKADTSRFDTLVVFYTNEYKNIRVSDQDRIDYFLKDLDRKNIVKIYVKEIFIPDSTEPAYMQGRRSHAITKYLHRSAISYSKIKQLK